MDSGTANKPWQLTVQARLRSLAAQRATLIPGTIYGALAAAALAPVITAVGEQDYGLLVALFGVVGGVSGNLIASQIDAWKGLSELELAIELTGKAAADPAWRETLDKLLREFAAPSAVEAALSQPDRAWFVGVLRQEIAQLGSSITAGGDAILGEVKVEGDYAATAIGSNITQNIHNVQNVYTQSADTPDPTTLRTAYLNRLFTQANVLSLAGIDPKAASDEAEARLNLGTVYTALLTMTPESHEGIVLGRAPDQEERQISAVAQLNRHRRLVLLGDPGSGKSTFVNFVALCLAGEALAHRQLNLTLLTAPLPDDMAAAADNEEKPPSQPWSLGALLPVRVVLRDFAARGLPSDGATATASHLWRFIAAELEAAALDDYAPHLHKELMNQGGLVLLDGLDEVPDAENQRGQIKHAVEDFADTFSRCRILVTSRTYAYQHQEWRLANFVATVLAPFTKGQISSFVERWYAHIAEVRHLNAEDAQGRAEVLKHAIFASDRLQALAERPLLLTLTASLHAWRGGSLPDRREELYADAVDLLLDWWESQRVARDAQGNTVMIQPSLSEWLRVDRTKVRTLLNEVAFEVHASQPTLVGTADIPESMLVTRLLYISENEDVKPRLLVAYLSQRAGLLLPRGVKNYTFPHRTFQEYLAACYLTDTDYPDTLAELSRHQPTRWREVTLLAGAKAARGTASAIWSLVDALCFREPTDPGHTSADVWGAHLAGQVIIEAANLSQISPRHQPKVERVCRGLIHALGQRDLPPLERAQAGRGLARLGDHRLPVVTNDHMEFCYVPEGPFAMGDKGETYVIPYAFWIARYPVTNAQYKAFVEANGYTDAQFWPEALKAGFWNADGFQGRYDGKPRRAPRSLGEPFALANHPVVGVTWYEAVAFTRWLSNYLHEAELLYPDWTVQLPNEPEWEKAGRGGLQIPAAPVLQVLGEMDMPPALPCALTNNPLLQRLFPWGDEIDTDRANYERTEIGSTSVVGAFPLGASPYGVEEMSGNVWEWTRSLLRDLPYPADARGQASRENLAAHAEAPRVLRGGAFHFYEYFVRCSERYGCNPDELGKLYGFRIIVKPSMS